jgi:hypothetical protein
MTATYRSRYRRVGLLTALLIIHLLVPRLEPVEIWGRKRPGVTYNSASAGGLGHREPAMLSVRTELRWPGRNMTDARPLNSTDNPVRHREENDGQLSVLQIYHAAIFPQVSRWF